MTLHHPVLRGKCTERCISDVAGHAFSVSSNKVDAHASHFQYLVRSGPNHRTALLQISGVKRQTESLRENARAKARERRREGHARTHARTHQREREREIKYEGEK